MASMSRKAKAEQKARAKAAQIADEQAKGKRLWKLLNTGAALVAGMLTAKALDATWKTATGHKPPNKPEHPDLGGREALFWAALSGMAIGVMKDVREPPGRDLLGQVDRRLPPGMPARGLRGDREKRSPDRPATADRSRQTAPPRRLTPAQLHDCARRLSGRAVHADQLPVAIRGELAAVVDQEALRAGELVGLARQHLDGQLFV